MKPARISAVLVATMVAASVGAAAAQAAGPSLPGRFVVQGAPLVKNGKVGAGRSISVFARPGAVVVEGCRSRSAAVRVRRGRALLSARFTCKGVSRVSRLEATISGARLRGTLTRGRNKRRFSARLRAPAGRRFHIGAQAGWPRWRDVAVDVARDAAFQPDRLGSEGRQLGRRV